MRHSRLLASILAVSLAVPLALGAQDSSTDLRSKIEEKAAELQRIQAQREAVERSLEGVAETANTLKREINVIDANINQLNLSIRANTLLLEKFGYEYETLEQDIEDIKVNVELTKDALRQLFVELQEREQENLLMMLLRSATLSKSVSELQTLIALNFALTTRIGDLKNLQAALAVKLEEINRNKERRRVEQTNLASRQVIVQEQKTEKQLVLSVTKSQEQLYQKQLDDLKALQSEVSKEIEAIESEFRHTIDPNLLPIPRPGVLLWPVAGGRLTQAYGRTPFAIRNYGSQYHNGIDIGAPIGTEVFAAEVGTIINVGNQDAYRGCYRAAYGKFVVVKHENGLTTLYGHLSRYIVAVGQRVEMGQVIGYVGRTGWATGAHLHFTVFASQTITPAKAGYPEGTMPSRVCGPMPVGGDLNPLRYTEAP